MDLFQPRPEAPAPDPLPGPSSASTTLIVRDVPIAVRDGIDLAMRTSTHRKREAFLRDHLERAFGPESATYGASRRFHDALEYIFGLGTSGFQEAPTLARLARTLGHPSVADLDAQFRGDVPLTFGVGDKTADLYGINRDWLHDGEGLPFQQTAKYREPYEVLHSFYRDGIPYDTLHFVLEVAPRGTMAIFGEASPLRYDLLLEGTPVHGDVGGGGQMRIEALGVTLSLIANIGVEHRHLSHGLKERHALLNGPPTDGHELDASDYNALIQGAIHPASIFRDAKRRRSVWQDYFADIERDSDFAKNFQDARKLFISSMEGHDVRTNAQLVEYARQRCLVPIEISPMQAIELLAKAWANGERPTEEQWAQADAAVAQAQNGDTSACIKVHVNLSALGKATPSWCSSL